MSSKRKQPTLAERKRMAQSARDKARSRQEKKLGMSRQPKQQQQRRGGGRRGRSGFSAPGLGRAIGGFFGPTGAMIGNAAGNIFKSLTGFGDYKVNSNSLSTNVDSLPSFSNLSRGTRVTHREFLFDVVTSPTIGAFSIEKVPIQPALLQAFPWLSASAEQYQQYQLNGLVYEFKSNSYNALASTNTASGTVIMSTNYNVLEPDFANKFTMEQSQYTCSGKPSNDLLHPIECARAETPASTLYTRSGAVTIGDARLYDWGNFYIATVGMQGASTNIGELWVTYDLTLLKPKLNSTVDVYDHWVLSAANALPGGPGYFGDVGFPPVLTADSDLGTVLVANSGGNYNQIVFPEGYTGKVMLLYVVAGVSVASATLASGFTSTRSGGVTLIPAFSSGPSTGADNEQGTMFYNANGFTTVTVFLNVVNGGSITFTGGTNGDTTPSAADLMVLALPTNFFTSPLPPVLTSSEEKLRPIIGDIKRGKLQDETPLDNPYGVEKVGVDEDGDYIMETGAETEGQGSKTPVKEQPAPGVRLTPLVPPGMARRLPKLPYGRLRDSQAV